ncbi:glutamyl aminopeptidase [Enterococcus pallens]|uniref:Glutamyl aminopeptidase n=1 Tax=Enterococcus pallens ATCC BAA-351 TaxID=1158607 RepID=R2S362_9ENTE|nr:glutamyl aminopeptidase [Enterococcus pallens]EOH87296.1 glutamyl aminopeptidase [Enterococcus pallens ATCC BAA-351]EOU18238.1 glutamyl aminopeptidase [Enterococcus pallens ATCC BAA-351]OJG77074.1 glutamyl aminopeptidase [Enterococcus pallens]
MKEATFNRIKELTELQGTSGFEDDIRAYLKREMTPLVDDIQQDGLGGIFGLKHAADDAPRVMVAAHMDEVGFMLTEITPRGLFKVVPLGGWNPYVVSAQRFTLKTKKGNYPCISSSVPPHLLRGTGGQAQVKVEDILFDAGFESKEEALEYGVLPGDTIVPQVETIKTANGKNIISKAWDNRYGCTVVLEALEALKEEDLDYTLIAGANVQEEVGLRGARPAVTKFKPDLFFAVDCSAADDLTTTNGTFGHLGEGTLLRIQDPGMILLPRLREYLLDTAETHNIPYQYFVSKGGTDAGAAHMANEGIPSSVIGVCGRYIHTHQTMFSIADFDAAREMLIQVLKGLDQSTINTIIYG